MDDLTVSALRLGASREAAGAPLQDRHIADLAGGKVFPIGSDLLHGFVSGLAEEFPSMFGVGNIGGDLLDASLASGRTGLAFTAGKYAAVGTIELLGELIRMARHRDGSAQAQQEGQNAQAALGAAAAQSSQFREALQGAGFDPGRVQFGNFPPGSVAIERGKVILRPASARGNRPNPRPAVRPATPRTAAAPPAAARPAAPPVAAPAPAAAPAAAVRRPRYVPTQQLQATAKADLVNGSVLIGASRFSVASALQLVDEVTAAVRELTLPAEGYTWVPDAAEPGALISLVLLDGAQASGLPEVPTLGGWLRGLVKSNRLVSSDGPLLFERSLIRRDGSGVKEPTADLHTGMVELAAAVRALGEGQ